ncbi:MAG: hypothetical protein ABF856_05190 [Acetobacter aceti]
MKDTPDFQTPMLKFLDAVAHLADAYETLQKDETEISAIVDPVMSGRDTILSLYIGSNLTMLALEQTHGDFVGGLCARMPSREEAQRLLDSILDEEQTKIFAILRDHFPDQDEQDAQLESVLRASCLRLRKHAERHIDGRHPPGSNQE